MKTKTNLVGKSFEELSLDEMMEIQGAADADPASTIAIPISTIEVSEAISTLVSVSVASYASYLATKRKKCK